MNTQISVLLLAAGSGQRMQGTVSDKILASLNGQSVFAYSIQAFLDSGLIDRFTIVYRDAPQREALAAILKAFTIPENSVHWVQGGQERQDSVYRALQAQDSDCTHVFIHDCARPLIQPQAIQALWQAVQRDSAAVLAHPPTDTLKRIASADQLERCKLEDLDRSRLWAMETPQAFDFPKIHQAYCQVQEAGLRVTDDTAAAATIGLKTTLVHNTRPNPKITGPADLSYSEWLLQQAPR